MTATLIPGRTDDVQAAERAVLGTIITSRPIAEAALEVLTRDDDFSTGLHQAVAAAVRYLTETGGPLGEPAVLARLVAAETGVWHTGEAGPIITGLVRHASPSWSAYVQVIHRAAVQRRTLDALTSATQLASHPGFDPAAGGDQIRDRIETALTPARPAAGPVTAASLFNDTIDRLDSPAPPGQVQFPWAALRDLVPWLLPHQLITIAARPSIGKSALGQDLARHVALHLHLPVVLFTMEMNRGQVMNRLIAAEARVPYERLVTKTLGKPDWERISAARERFADAGDLLVIDDTTEVSLPHARAQLRGMARTNPAQLAIFDYLQLMAAPRAENRQQEVTALVKGLKQIAREQNLPVVMLAQLNRSVETRADRRPAIADVRESGSIENDSDVVILIHRPDFYAPAKRPGEADLIVDKHRDGRRGTATAGFQGRYMRFVDLTWAPAPPPPPPAARPVTTAAEAHAQAEDRQDELARKRSQHLAGPGVASPPQ